MSTETKLPEVSFNRVSNTLVIPHGHELVEHEGRMAIRNSEGAVHFLTDFEQIPKDATIRGLKVKPEGASVNGYPWIGKRQDIAHIDMAEQHKLVNGEAAAVGEVTEGAAKTAGDVEQTEKEVKQVTEEITGDGRSMVSKLFQKEVALENGVKELKFAPGKTAAVGIGAVGGLWLLSKVLGGGKKDNWQDKVASSSMETGQGRA